MPIRPFLTGQIFDPETTRIMGVAFEIAYTAFRLADRGPAEAIVAQRIIELASAGERNPDLLCEKVLFEFANPALELAEYHLIDLATGFSHGGFKSLAAARQSRILEFGAENGRNYCAWLPSFSFVSPCSSFWSCWFFII